MTWALWLAIFISASALSYVTQFTGATLAMGSALDEGQPGTGFQYAITPPWHTKITMLVYIGTLASLVLVFWRLGIVSGLLAIPVLFIVAIVVRRMLPLPQSQHFVQLILRSMSNRYADYIRRGDSVRADAMKLLLKRAGIDPDEIQRA